jgi:hypothetical protein
MMARKKNGSAKEPAASVQALKHKDRRTNIPTRELRGFVEGDESRPPTVLYPRDPSLDPQLVWKGKDDQDRQPLAVPAVPIYIQEKISPQALVEELRQRQKEADPQPSLFADFNGIEFEQLVEFYRHSQNWAHRLILGDSLLVMNSLAEKERLKGQVQMIYLDPTCGSGTTAYVAEQWGRRWITIDTSRVALALARTRLMTAKFPYYLLADSAAGRKKEAELDPLLARPGLTAVAWRTIASVRPGGRFR